MSERLQTRIEEVTSRQLEVARLVAEGRTNPEIAAALGITLDGAKYHVSELLGRLGLERREEIRDWYRSEHRGRRLRRFGALFASVPRAFATGATVAAVVGAGALLAVGIEGGRAQEAVTHTTATPTATPPLEPGAAPPLGASGTASNLPSGLDWLVATLAARLRSAEIPEVVSWERVDWFDGCFDIDPAGGCPLSVSPVPGYRVVMRLGGEEYIARTALEGERYALEFAPLLAPFDAVFEWSGTASDVAICLEIGLAESGAGSVASCGEAATPVEVADSDVGSLAALDYLRSRATYEIVPGQGSGTASLFVRGTSEEAPGRLPRAAEEWGRLLAIDSYLGQGGAVAIPTISWEDSSVEGCMSVDVQQYGKVDLRGCPEGSDGSRYLEDDQLTQLYEWLDTYASFDPSDDGPALAFTGLGTAVADSAVRESMRAFVTTLAEAGPTAGE